MPELAAMVVVVVVLLSTVAEAELPTVVVLDRGLRLKELPEGLRLKHLRQLDRARHARTGVINMTLDGSFIPMGLYYTSVKLGNPPKKYTFQIDTGSSIPWVACKGCAGCSTKNVAMELYNPESSSISSTISCSDDKCRTAEQSGSEICQSATGLCGYDFSYGDQTRVSGNYVSDTMYFDTIVGNGSSGNSSASIIFGCTTSLSQVMKTDGLLGFGQDPLSMISQLNSQGISPKAFSHCLKGSEDGGGILVLGKIAAPGLAYTPLDPSQSLYNVNLESIDVNGKRLPIDSSLFATSDSQGTIVDSGTTLAYIVEGAYVPLVNAISAAIPKSVKPVDTHLNAKRDQRDKCFVTSSSIDVFPTVTLYFKGGAAMTVKPPQYLLEMGTYENDVVWCVAWQSTQVLQDVQGITILGDIVLHDKLIVYDLGKGRLGWTDYNCSSFNRSSPIDVSGAPTYYRGVMIFIGVAAIWLASLMQ